MNELDRALFDVQGDLYGVTRNKENTFTKAKYADLEAVLTEIKPVLQAHGILLQQSVHGEHDGFITVGTRLVHVASGQEQTTVAKLASSGSGDAQALGSANTYLSRYALMALFALPQVDDDGHSASTMAPNTLKAYEQLLTDCSDMDDLKEAYTKGVADAGSDTIARKAIVEAKNRQKNIIECHSAYECNKEAVDTTRDFLAADDYYAAAEAWATVSDADAMDINLAPTKGGILTTKERAQLKSDDFGEARRSFIQANKAV
jgi:hypothetical protein